MSILDVGCGIGHLTTYLALMGADKIVGLEPMLSGSADNSFLIFKRSIEELELSNCVAINGTFQEFNSKPHEFDILISYNSINHLDDDRCRKLHYDSESWGHYLGMMKKAYTMLNSRGVFVIADCSRTNIYSKLGKLGIKNPFMSDINWEIHQHPRTWKLLLKEAGFTRIRYWWNTPYQLRGIKFLLSNRFFSYLTTSNFVIHAFV